MRVVLHQVTKKYEEKSALKNVSIAFESGRIYGIHGRMASGKSTLLKSIAGLIVIDSGRIEVPFRKCEISFLDHDKGIYNDMTALENLKFWKKVYGQNSRPTEYVVSALDLAAILNSRIVELSAGNQQLVALATALMNRYKLLILDEPTVNLDRPTKVKLFRLIKQNQANSITIVSTHLIDEINELCTTRVNMDNGEIEGCQEAITINS